MTVELVLEDEIYGDCRLLIELILISLVKLSQMATYWFVIGWFDNQSAQKSEVRQVAKDVVKSEVYP